LKSASPQTPAVAAREIA